jgi:hypothetical protein
MSKNSLSKNAWLLASGMTFAAFAACSEPVVHPDPPPGDVSEVKGTITADATWSGVINMTEDTTIASGVTVTIAPDSWIEAAEGSFLRVEGNLLVAGTAEQPVTVYPLDTAPSWGGITVEAGGSADIQYLQGEHVSALLFCKEGALGCRLDSVRFVHLGNAIITNAASEISNSYFEDMANAGISVRAGADLSIVDSYILTSDHDLIVTQGGSRLTVDHSEVGGAQGSYEHCNFHIGGADYVSITNSNLISSVYAVMIGNTSDAILQYNNIMDNDNDVLEVGANTNVDLRYNYWSRGAPSLGAAYDTASAAGEPYAESGPRW